MYPLAELLLLVESDDPFALVYEKVSIFLNAFLSYCKWLFCCVLEKKLDGIDND